MKKLIIKKCTSCNATVKVLQDCTCDNCGINCCGKPMRKLKANESDGIAEKHKPTFKVDGNYIVVNVDHVMDEDHYIEWIVHVYENRICRVNLKPGEKPVAKFAYKPGATLYAMCNKHGLWKVDVE